MVLRYKALAAAVIIFFAAIWLSGRDYYPLSSTKMYSLPADVPESDFYYVRDASGAIVNDNGRFYVAPSPSGDEIAGKECFRGGERACHDYFLLLARWLQQPVTVEHWKWNFKTGIRYRVEAVTFEP